MAGGHQPWHPARQQLIAISGGESSGDPCEALSHHGFNGVEPSTVRKIGDWIADKQ